MTSQEEKATEDLELLRAASLKDHEAFRRLVEKHQDKIIRICHGFVRDPQEAEDLAQEVFFRVYKNAGRFHGRSRVSTWMYRIAVNCSLNRLRKLRVQTWMRSAGRGESGSGELEQLMSREEPPDVVLERKERRRLLREALDRLSSDQRIAFTLHNIEGMSYEEIARIMDCSVSAVESRIHRAKLNLQKYLVPRLEKLG